MPESKEEKQITKLIQSSLKGSRQSQKLLYQQFYGYGMTVCIRYAKNREEAQEILNDGFIKAFKNLHRFDFKKPFRIWLRRILINTAIDSLRKNKKYHQTNDLDQAYDISVEADGLNTLSAQEILQLVQKLAPSYRAVFNLYAIEGFSHKEVSKQLEISIGTSKSNLAMARKRLKAMYLKLHQNIKV
jgi:RNA polymerase sigma-70 factor (ECF subfamily)